MPPAASPTTPPTTPPTDFATLIAQDWPPPQWRDLCVVVALSGGADSMALLRALLAIQQKSGGKGAISACHFNHQLRGEESQADQQWVMAECQRLQVPLRCGQATLTSDSEEAARTARYDFLRQVAAESGARYVATGHTLDDQVETILLRILRGTGLAGLAGIPFTRPLTDMVNVVRPLLKRRRTEVEAYLHGLAQNYRHDHSNDSPRYTRNWIRQELLPVLNDRLGNTVGKSLLSLSRQATEAHTVLALQAAVLVEDYFVISPQGRSVTIQQPPLASEPPLLVREACRLAWRTVGWPQQAMGQHEWRQLEQQITALHATAAITLPGGVRVERRDGVVVLASSRGCFS